MDVPHPNLAALSADISAIVNAAAPSAVAIEDHGRSFSGFFWRENIIVTASDLLAAKTGERVTLSADGHGVIEGGVIGHDASTDLAFIRILPNGPVLTPTPSFALGAVAVAVGRSGDGSLCGVGFVSLLGGPWRSMRGGEISQRVGIDMRLPRRLEGGAVVDVSGSLLGMAVSGPRRSVILIPPATIDRVGEELLAHGRIRHGYLGVSVRPVPLLPGQGAGDRSAGDRQTGLMVLSLDAAGPAARAGMMQGDILLSIAGQSPGTPRALARHLRSLAIGQKVDVAGLRAGSPLAISVTIGERPVA